MTYIEFFEKNAVENVCACLLNPPERVVFVGRDMKNMSRCAKQYQKVFSERGSKTKIILRAVNHNNLDAILSLLNELVDTYDDCLFDLTGGDDLYLVGVGMVYKSRTDKKIQLVRFNVFSGKVYDIDGDGLPRFLGAPQLSIEDNVAIYGGEVVYGQKDATLKWVNRDGLFEDINTMWDICKRDVKRWNNLLNVFESADKLTEKEGLESRADIVMLTSDTERLITRSSIDLDTVDELCRKGLLQSYEYNGRSFRVKYKNNQIKRCLTKAGQVLEMKIYLSALKATEEDGEPVYNSVLTGVCIDWDGVQSGTVTENEIDVMMMHGLIPVFVSCKNGFVEIDELYKLNTVAERFGGKYAKKVLIASALDTSNGFGKTLKMRADDMGIRLISEEVTKMSDSELIGKIKNFWR